MNKFKLNLRKDILPDIGHFSDQEKSWKCMPSSQIRGKHYIYHIWSSTQTNYFLKECCSKSHLDWLLFWSEFCSHKYQVQINIGKDILADFNCFSDQNSDNSALHWLHFFIIFLFKNKRIQECEQNSAQKSSWKQT